VDPAALISAFAFRTHAFHAVFLVNILSTAPARPTVITTHFECILSKVQVEHKLRQKINVFRQIVRAHAQSQIFSIKNIYTACVLTANVMAASQLNITIFWQETKLG